MITCLAPLNVHAIQSNGNGPIRSTNEGVMPSFDFTALGVAGEYSINAEKNHRTRAVWLQNAINTNEVAYGQKVNSVSEDQDYIVLYFDYKTIKNSDKVFTEDNIEYTDIVVDKILYLKPESSLSSEQTDTNSLAATAIPTKIVEYYSWTNGYVKLATKNVYFSDLLDILILLTPIDYTYTMNIVLWAAAGFISYLETYPELIKTETYNKYYYRNRCGQIQRAGYWTSVVYVGERRSFPWSWASFNDVYGQPILSKEPNPLNGIPSSNPTNFVSQEKKAHYNDDAWILNKVLQYQYIGGYYDAYGQAYTLD